jgi:uncharacterized membrane protein YccF (DUF307 family)
MSETVLKVERRSPTREVPFLLRVIWFFVLGWELTGAWILVAWFLNLTIIGLPLGLWMIDRVPQVLTLKSRPGAWVVDAKSGRTRFLLERQPAWPARLVWFALIGWWLSLLWAGLAWALCASIIGLPIGVLMLNALPTVTTLHK